jgi:pimeloyl-ACP methyl ester carboxylesterase
MSADMRVRRMLRRLGASLVAVCVLLQPLASQSVASASGIKREQFQNADVTYGWVNDDAGHKLRTFVTRPKNAAGKLPVIFFVGWLSCDSVEYPDGETDGFGVILRRLIEQSGFATMRLDKPGVGESQGDCSKTDFNTELSGYQSAFDAMLKYDFIDPNNVLMVGLSNGGGTSVLVPREHPVRGYIAASSWGRTWYEHMLELERGRLARAGKTPSEVTLAVKAFTEFYQLYLIRGMTPGEVVGLHPEWKTFWYDTPDGQYGRPAAFYQQLQSLNLGESWQNVSAPVLVMHGSSDPIMSDADARAIVEAVNRGHPAKARFVEVQGADHLMTVNGKFAESVIPTMIEWMRQQMAK